MVQPAYLHCKHLQSLHANLFPFSSMGPTWQVQHLKTHPICATPFPPSLEVTTSCPQFLGGTDAYVVHLQPHDLQLLLYPVKQECTVDDWYYGLPQPHCKPKGAFTDIPDAL